jgi:hypothetical protein
MKKLFGFLTVAVLTAGILLSCDLDLGGDNNTSGVDFNNYSTNYALHVNNSTSKDLVAFKGSLSASQLIGGVRAKTSSHYFKKSALFKDTGDFTLIFLTVEDYNANKSNLQALENTPFTRVWAFYNANGEGNDTVIEISDKLGGNKRLKINNMTSMNVELRLNGIQGPTLGYAAAEMLNTTLYVQPADYEIFPVFRRYDDTHDRVLTVYPRYTSGQFQGKPKVFSFNFDEDDEAILNTNVFLTNITFSTGSAYLVIENASSAGIKVYKGDIEQKTETGTSTINAGKNRTFRVDMAAIGSESNPAYASSASIAAYKIGPSMGPLNVEGNLKDEDGHTIQPNDLVVQVDTMYTITVRGSMDVGFTLTLKTETTPVDLDNFN